MRSSTAFRTPCAALIVAGGSGQRFATPGGKQLARAGSTPILGHAVAAFAAASDVGHIVVVCHPERLEEYRADAVGPFAGSTPYSVVPGGRERQDSVRNGLAAVPPGFDVILVHDGARPLVTAALIDAVLSRFADGDADALVVGHPVSDTLKVVEDGTVLETADRSRFWVAQTPQAFRLSTLREAHERAAESGVTATDDSALVEAAGGTVRMFSGPRDNIKVTLAEDLALVEAVLAVRSETS